MMWSSNTEAGNLMFKRDTLDSNKLLISQMTDNKYDLCNVFERDESVI